MSSKQSKGEESLTPIEQVELTELRAEREVKRKECAAEAESKYVDLCLAIAEGRETDDAAGEVALANCGRSMEDLARDLEMLRKTAASRHATALIWSATIAHREAQCV